jgi:hypothetical protein
VSSTECRRLEGAEYPAVGEPRMSQNVGVDLLAKRSEADAPLVAWVAVAAPRMSPGDDVWLLAPVPDEGFEGRHTGADRDAGYVALRHESWSIGVADVDLEPVDQGYG